MLSPVASHAALHFLKARNEVQIEQQLINIISLINFRSELRKIISSNLGRRRYATLQNKGLGLYLYEDTQHKLENINNLHF